MMTPTTACRILFEEKLINGEPLFKNQITLVDELLSHPLSHYYAPNRLDHESFEKARNRLKTYIYQLLSDDTSRAISTHLTKSITILVKEKLPNADKYLELIITDLQNCNPARTRSKPEKRHINVFTEEDFDVCKDYINAWIDSAILVDAKAMMDRYVQGQVAGIRQGAMLLYLFLKQKTGPQE